MHYMDNKDNLLGAGIGLDLLPGVNGLGSENFFCAML